MLKVVDTMKPQANGNTLTLILGDRKGRVIDTIELDEHELKKYWLQAKSKPKPEDDS